MTTIHNNIHHELQELASAIENAGTENSFQYLTDKYPNRVAFSTSFSYEDQAILNMLYQLPVKVFTLDTGRLFKQTYSTWSSALQHYKILIKAYYPNQNELEKFITQNGPNAFYNSVENRKQCCFIRKVEPLQRALEGNKIWITGLRAAHSAQRENLSIVEWDETNKIIKYHPLLHWSTEEVINYIKQNNIPYNPLHDNGFVSIGCEPCTRAVSEGEDFRAGRWWWEDASKKECGLHIHQ
jgi:phosphoadenosine phosphosulfate reductase